MPQLLKLVRRSDAAYITAADILKKDVLRWMAMAGILMLTVYGIGLLVSSADTENYPIHYYAQITFVNTPTAATVLLAFTCLGVTGSVRAVRFWIILLAMCVAWLVAAGSVISQIDPTRFAGAICAMMIVLAAWRLWEYIELRYVIKLESPRLTRPAVAIYSLLLTASVLLLLPI